MYPYIFGVSWLDSFTILICIGIVACLLLFRFNCTKLKIADKAYNFYLLNIVVSIIIGFLFAFLFQQLYNFIESLVNKNVEFHWGGITFLGGLIGGVASFILITLFKGDKEAKDNFWRVANIAVPSILLAHGIGRLGCFAAGCCYGIETNSIFGVKFPHLSMSVYPTQLFEAVFLLTLLAVSMFLIYKFKKEHLLLIIYSISYAIFRFLIEFIRGDSRGELIPGLSPSQIQSIIMLLIGIALAVMIYKFKKIPFQKKDK